MTIRRLARRAFLLALAGGLAACHGLPDGSLEQTRTPTVVDRAPMPRRTGERLPAFSGVDPRTRGWAKVDGLLWIHADHVEAYRAGQVFDGVGFVSVASPLPPGTQAERGYRLRTSHVALHTNAAWKRAEVVAREAEAHVTRLVGSYGDALDLRLPSGPLKVVVTATRAEFESVLAGLVRDPVGWGAFYDARSGNVYVSLEPAARGSMPWQADLRHEMTHQILDLSRATSLRGRAFPPPWFWLWEGIALHAEGLGGGAPSPRPARFQRRRARNEWTPLAELVRLGPWSFEGRHYDQTASLMGYLLDPADPQVRAGTLSLVRDLLRGGVEAQALERRTGLDVATLQQRWLGTLAH